MNYWICTSTQKTAAKIGYVPRTARLGCLRPGTDARRSMAARPDIVSRSALFSSASFDSSRLAPAVTTLYRRRDRRHAASAPQRSAMRAPLRDAANRSEEEGMDAVKRLRIAYTPDSDDAFYYDALETGQVSLPDYKLAFYRQPMSVSIEPPCTARTRNNRHFLYSLSRKFCAAMPFSVSARALAAGYGPVLVSRVSRSSAERQAGPSASPAYRRLAGFLLRACAQMRSQSKCRSTASLRPLPAVKWKPVS